MDVFLQSENRYLSLPVFLRQIGALQHMEQLKFNAICPAAPHVSGGFHHILPAFSGEAKDNMCDYFQAGSFECADCVIIDRQRVPAPDVTGAVWMYGLQSQLHPNGFDLIEALQKGQDLWPKAVRARGDRERNNLRRSDCLAKQSVQVREGGIGIGKALKISNVLTTFIFMGNPLLGVGQLFCHMSTRRRSEFPCANLTTENAAAGS